MTSKRLGATAVVGETQELLGIITDGDLRRMLEKNANTTGVHATDIMSSKPTTIQKDALAVEALEVLTIERYQPVAGDGWEGLCGIYSYA